MPNFIDLTGQRFGKLLVLYRIGTTGSKWWCRCDCGNELSRNGVSLRKGLTTSCGCSKKGSPDLTGKQFGELTVLYICKEKTNYGKRMWHCKCSCGKECDVSGQCLTQGHTKSCGCKNHMIKDISGQRFGKLIALYPKTEIKHHHTLWHCKCDCGNEKDIDINSLITGSTVSCGCLKISKGEEKISLLLKNNNILFKPQFTFNELRGQNKQPYRFDFGVLNSDGDLIYLIEYDGEQHFSYKEHNGGWNNKENFEKTQHRDIEKNQWCQDNNIPLIRIPYTQYENLCIEDLKLETSQFILK